MRGGVYRARDAEPPRACCACCSDTDDEGVGAHQKANVARPIGRCRGAFAPYAASRMPNEYGDYAALDPFFRIIEEGLAGFVDGGHFFDLLAEDVVFEYRDLRSRIPATG